MKKKICAEKLNFGLLPKYIARLGSWARLLGVQALGARRARRRACVGARARAQVVAGRWASGRAAGARAAGGRWAGARQQRAGRAGRAGNGRQARGQARRGRAGARGWAHGARKARPA